MIITTTANCFKIINLPASGRKRSVDDRTNKDRANRNKQCNKIAFLVHHCCHRDRHRKTVSIAIFAIIRFFLLLVFLLVFAIVLVPVIKVTISVDDCYQCL